jgi:OmpR-family two-component system manganese-sensing sensor histidine kinase
MIPSLRRRLTLLFLCLFLLIYGLGGAAALAVFYSGLTAAMDEEISDLSSEVLPAIKFDANSEPNLKTWAAAAAQEHLSFPAGIQLYDKNKHLLESYGPSGKSLFEGEFYIQYKGRKTLLRSNFEPLKNNGQTSGYLQIQMDTDKRDDAVQQFALTILLILPFLAVAVVLAGYFFSGLAIKPVEKSIQVLKTFVADAGHEFITPVTVVEASIQTLEEILKEHGIGLEVLNIISRASNTMKELSSDLIYLAKIDNPAADLVQEDLKVNEIIEPAVEAIIELARSKNIELKCLPVPDLTVKGNVHALKTMVSNLLSNAIKYSDNGSAVKLSVTEENNKVCIAVEDNGIGIPEQDIEHIFDRFYRVDQSRARSAGGSGLGLAIVKAILDLHRAEIDVQSTLGKGTKFTVRMHKVAY